MLGVLVTLPALLGMQYRIHCIRITMSWVYIASEGALMYDVIMQ